MVDDTWSWRDYPILEAAVRAEAQDLDLGAAINDGTRGLTIEDRERGVRALVESDFLTGTRIPLGHGPRRYRVVGVTGKARRATRQWPSARAYDDLVDVLEQRIATTTDESKKSKLRALLGALANVGKDLTADVLARVIEHQAGMS